MIDFLTTGSRLQIDSIVLIVDLALIELAEVDEDAFAVELLAHYDFLSLGHLAHPDDDLEVVAVGQRDQVGQLVDVFGLHLDAS